MFQFIRIYFFIPKMTWENWKQNHDDEGLYSAELTPDETFYCIPVFGWNDAQKAELSGIANVVKVAGKDMIDFSNANQAMFIETGDGQPPVERAPMLHPSMQDVYEMTHLYDGTNATLTFNQNQDSVWEIPLDCFPNGGVSDVFVEDNFIRLKRSKFGPDGIPGGESRYIYESPETILVHTYGITSAQEGNGIVTVNLDIPSL